MRRRDWVQIYALLGAGLVVDQLTKKWMLAQGTVSFGPLKLAVARNYGFIMGSFSNLSDEIVAMSLASLVAALFFLTSLIHFLLPWRGLGFRFGLNLTMAGILGNFLDQLMAGYVVDFIRMATPFGRNIVFNLADVFQLVGYGMMVTWLVRNRKVVFHADDQRAGYWVDRQFQTRYCAGLVLAGGAICLALVLFGGTYLWQSVRSLPGGDEVLATRYLWPYLAVCAAMTVSFIAMLVVFGLIQSHRVAGPVYALERFLIERKKGTKAKFQLRDSDDLQALERIVHELLD